MRKIGCSILLLLFYGQILLAQDFEFQVTPSQDRLKVKADSLELQLLQTPDSLQWDLLDELGRVLSKMAQWDSVALTKGITYSEKAIELAQLQSDTVRWVQSMRKLRVFYGLDGSFEEEIQEMKRRERLLSATRGYVVTQDFAESDENWRSSLNGKMWVHYDSTSTRSLAEIRQFSLGEEMELFALKERDLNEYPGSWWVRFRLRSQLDRWKELVMYCSEDGSFWDTVEVYTPNPEGVYGMVRTGKGLNKSEWEVPERANHFRVSIPAKGDIDVFLRLRGFPPGQAPETIRIRHINYEAFLQDRVKTRHTNGIFQGVVLIQLLFFLFLFLSTRDRIYGNYVIYILGLSLFILTVNYLRDDQRDVIEAIMYLVSIWLSTVGMLRFSYVYLNMQELMPKWRKPLRTFLIIFTFISLIIAITLPITVAGIAGDNITENIFPIILGFSAFFYFLLVFTAAIFLPIWGIRTWRKGYAPAKYYLIATLFLFLGFLLPISISIFWENFESTAFIEAISLPNLIGGGIALQLSLFALGVGHQKNLLEKERREALEQNLAMQQEINAATDRFVPYEFLKTLGRESILDVNLGDQVEKNVTVFFSDIRDYTTLSEQLTPQQNFLFLNNYLGRVGPIIKTNRGFVNQYYGDGFLALFMGAESGINSPKDSVQAALHMHKELQRYNGERVEKGRDPIRIGIGIHTGPLMLGVIGDEKRMDVGVVSDAVNTAARMEGLTKYYGSTTILSGATFQGIGETDGMNYRYLGKVLVKGKKEPIKIYDFFDGDHEGIGEKKASSLALFGEGLDTFFAKDFQTAQKIFQEILLSFPEDKASIAYLEKCKYYLESGVPEDWTGVDHIGRK